MSDDEDALDIASDLAAERVRTLLAPVSNGLSCWRSSAPM